MNGEASRVFTVSGTSPESRPRASGVANVLAVSKSGELAVIEACEDYLMPTAQCGGTLGRMNVSGSAPRKSPPVFGRRTVSGWKGPGGDSRGGRTVSAGINNVLAETSGWMSAFRISPNGNWIAYVEHPAVGDDSGTMTIIDRDGSRKQSSGPWDSIEGLAWTPSGNEVWYSAAKGLEGWANTLRGLDLNGRVRRILRLPDLSRLHDISSDESVLLSTESFTLELMVKLAGEGKERDLSWLEQPESPT